MTYVVVCLIFAKPECVEDVRNKLLEIAKICKTAFAASNLYPADLALIACC
jgi:hypothetical protein